jgi:hypothetical protein
MDSRAVRSGERARVGYGPIANRAGAGRAARGLALALGLLLATSAAAGAQALTTDAGPVVAQTLVADGSGLFAQTAAPGSGVTTMPVGGGSMFAQTAAPGPGVTTSPAPFVAPAPAAASGAGAPRFPALGPAQPAPDAEGPARANSPLPTGRTQRCRWDLAGIWEGRGQQTDPTSNSYATRLVVQQYGNYLAVQQPADGITYFGVCAGDRVELDAYSGDTYIGVQTGTVGNNGRRIESTWVLYRPDYAAGYETLTASGRPSR